MRRIITLFAFAAVTIASMAQSYTYYSNNGSSQVYYSTNNKNNNSRKDELTKCLESMPSDKIVGTSGEQGHDKLDSIYFLNTKTYDFPYVNHWDKENVDRLIAKYNRISPSKALIFQAIGAERAESLCDLFCDEMKEKYSTNPRYSPGYGDLPLDIQRDIFAVLDCPRKIGLTLNDSLLMSPSKSVTAIIGVKP